jgi:hypothetical protein
MFDYQKVTHGGFYQQKLLWVLQSKISSSTTIKIEDINIKYEDLTIKNEEASIPYCTTFLGVRGKTSRITVPAILV